jgi:hypothetical protein
MPIALGVNISMSSWPGSSRPSTPSILLGLEDVDARDKRGHDECKFNAPASIGARLSCGRAAATPSPLVGEGWGGGSGGCGNDMPPLTTPTTDPSPHGGGENEGAAPNAIALPAHGRRQ